MTAELTTRQRDVLSFIAQSQQEQGHAPTLREIARHLDANVTAAADHVRALKRKGVLQSSAGRARSLRLSEPQTVARKTLLDIAILGSIPAGFPQDKQQENRCSITLDVESLGIKPTARTFALEVRGDSMIGRHIMDGDYVILEHGVTPRPGDVVAALVDNESTLKTYIMEKGKPCLRAENPKYPRIEPASELVIQGVMVGLIRRQKIARK